PREIGACRPGQLRMLLYADRALLPARHLFIHRGAQLELLGAHGQNLGETALELVADADLYRLDPVEHVELGDAYARDAVQLDRALERRCVEPAGAPRPSGGRAELAPLLAQVLAYAVRELGRERPTADARRIGLGDTEHVVQVLRTDARARSRRTGHTVRR